MVSKRPAGNYSDPSVSATTGNYAPPPGQFDGSLRVVTWNLHYGEKLPEIVSTLESNDHLKGADILLFQELDKDGVEKLSQELHYNYVYYPAAFDRDNNKEYGNAILSKWPLHEAQKIVLPNLLPGWLEDRSAAKALAQIDDFGIMLYSVHLDVIWMDPQGNFLAEGVEPTPALVIVGGDFNTWRQASISNLESRMAGVGLERLSAGTGYTFIRSGYPFTLDHIFGVQGLDYTAGVDQQINASDHFPIWADIILNSK